MNLQAVNFYPTDTVLSIFHPYNNLLIQQALGHTLYNCESKFMNFYANKISVKCFYSSNTISIYLTKLLPPTFKSVDHLGDHTILNIYNLFL